MDNNVRFLTDDAIDSINKVLPDTKTLRAISEFFSIFSDATRIKIISALSVDDMCVTDLATLLDTHQSTISHQLRILKNYGVVNYRREGKMIIYFIENVLVEDVMGLGVENMKNMLLKAY